MASLFAAAEYEAVEAVIVDINPILENEHVLEPFEETDVDIVVSYHDFSENPGIQDLELVIEHAAEYGDVVKVATMAESPDDALVLLAAIHSASEDGITIGGWLWVR